MRSLETAATSFGVWCGFVGCIWLAGCNYDNPGFKVKGNAEAGASSETSVSGATSETSESSAPVTTATTEEPPTSTGMVATAGSGTEDPGSTTEAITSDVTGTTGEPLNNECGQPEVVEVPVLADTFLVVRTVDDAVACGLLDEIAPGQFDPNSGYCENWNLGKVATLKLVDVPNEEGRDAIHYLVKFDVGKLLDKNTDEPVKLVQIKNAELHVTIERLGDPVLLGAYPLLPDDVWVEGKEDGPAVMGDPSYRCRKAPGVDNQEGACLGKWHHTLPIPKGASPTREALTDSVDKGMSGGVKFAFLPSDFAGELEGFFDAKSGHHHGFFIALPLEDPNSTPDKVKVLAREAAEEDPRLVVTYCPAGT